VSFFDEAEREPKTGKVMCRDNETHAAESVKLPQP
jgi:hypothetical protein